MAAPRPPRLEHPLVGTFIRAFSRFNVWVYQLTGGLLGSRWRVGAAFPWGLPVLLLTTTGRKSGKKRTAPLLYIEDGDALVVVASQGGRPADPLWFRNVCADPDVTVQIGRSVRPMRARVASPEERAALWPRLVAHYADFDNYQAWTDRVIPVVRLEPAAQVGQAPGALHAAGEAARRVSDT